MNTKSILPLIIFNMANFFLYNFANAYLTDTLGKITFGHFMLGISLLSALAPILLFGNYYIITQDIPTHVENKNKKKLQELINWSLKFLITCFIIVSIFTAVLLAAQSMGYISCHTRVCNNNSVFYLDALYITPLYIIMFWNTGYLATIQENTLSTVLSANAGSGILIYVFSAIIAIAHTYFQVISYATVLIAFVIAQLILLIIQNIVMHHSKQRPLKLTLIDCFQSNTPSWVQQKRLYQRSVFYVPCDILYALVGISTVIAIEAAHPLKSTLSSYYIAGFIASIISCICNAYQTIMYPLYSLAGTSKPASTQLESIFKSQIINGAITTIVASVILFLLKPQILQLYSINDPVFLTGVILLITYNYLSSVWVQPENMLAYHGKMTSVYIGNACQGIIQLAVCYFLVTKIGFIGAIIAQYAGGIVCSIICYRSFVKAKIPVKPFGIY